MMITADLQILLMCTLALWPKIKTDHSPWSVSLLAPRRPSAQLRFADHRPHASKLRKRIQFSIRPGCFHRLSSMKRASSILQLLVNWSQQRKLSSSFPLPPSARVLLGAKVVKRPRIHLQHNALSGFCQFLISKPGYFPSINIYFKL